MARSIVTIRKESWLERDRPNGLNFLRLLFASLVIFSHAWNLNGEVDPFVRFLRQQWGLSSIAVDAFFVISGFLIVGSYCSPSSTADKFIRNRILRIVPGFIAAVGFSIAVTAIAAGTQWQAYLRSIHYEAAIFQMSTLNARFLDTIIAFPTVPVHNVVNGSLWTIPIEFSCYMAVAFAGTLGILRKKWVAVGLFFFCLICFGVNEVQSGGDYRVTWRFASCFISGGLFYLYREIIPRRRSLAVLCVLALTLSFLVRSGLQLALPIFGSYVLFYAAFGMPDFLNRIGSKHDISYGIYLYAFPLQQVFYQWAGDGLMPRSPMLNFLVAGLATFAVAWLSCIFVEAPFMAMRHRIGFVPAKVHGRP
jgi:peptidoglycan/LPS O-acetylase OafA/YrhL